MSFGQRYARFATNVVTRVPGAWVLFRRPVASMFDRLAREWDATRADPSRMRAIRAALEAIGEPPPARVLDIGTGTGAAARVSAELWPAAQIVGVDVSSGMIEEARRLASCEREQYQVADSAHLPFADASFDAVSLNNMIPFYDELARVTAPGGHVAIAFSLGDRTPIFVPPARVVAELERRGFAHVASFEQAPGISLLAKKADRS
jgi:ubiquinone/menaquinone biosynthesis C-methylase UbiE